MTSIHDQIRKAIDASGRSRAGIARACDVAYETVHDLYHGKDARLSTVESLLAEIRCELAVRRKKR